jgi:hypothetical protein
MVQIWPGAMHTVSVFAKPGERSGISLEMRDDQIGKYGLMRFDLRHEAPMSSTGDVTECGIERLADGWLRVWAVMPFASDRAVVDFALLNASGELRYPGDGKAGLLIWGLQVEPGTAPSFYLATRDGPQIDTR